MLTFSINLDGVKHSTRIWDAINSNIQYFKKFNGELWSEAAQKTYVYAMEHIDESYTDLNPYIKKLARTILKVQEKEKPYDLMTEDGEVALVFTSLTETIDDKIFLNKRELMDSFKELYLYAPEDFIKLKYIFKYDDEKEMLSIRSLIIKNEQLKREFYALLTKYGADCVFYTLYDFFKNLSKFTEVNNRRGIKEVLARESNFLLLSRIPNSPCIKTSDGKYHSIDRNTLSMDINPDFVNWDVSFSTNCNIMKIDLSPLINYMYEQVYVEKGVRTKHITWCDDKYRLTTPGGDVFICEDRTRFIDMVRIECILNLLENGLNTVIALSSESMYIKPTRTIYYDTIRYKFTSGKVIDLPITTHIEKRKPHCS